MKIGEALQQIRERAGLTAADIDKAMGEAPGKTQLREKSKQMQWSIIERYLEACVATTYDLAVVLDHLPPAEEEQPHDHDPAALYHGDRPEAIEEEVPEGLVLVFGHDQYRLGKIREVAGKVCLVDEDNQLIFSGSTYEDVLGQIPEEVAVYESRPV